MKPGSPATGIDAGLPLFRGLPGEAAARGQCTLMARDFTPDRTNWLSSRQKRANHGPRGSKSGEFRDERVAMRPFPAIIVVQRGLTLNV